MQTQQVVYMTKKKGKTLAEWGIIVALLCSFAFYAVFEAFQYGNGASLVSANESAAGAYATYVAFFAVIGWLIFELVMRLYYFFVSMSIYVFVIPKRKAYYTFRVAYAIRNLIVGGLALLLFVSPIWFSYFAVLSMIVDFFAIVFVFVWLKNKYLGTLLAPFAWKAFLRPFIVYEVLMLVIKVVIGL